MYLKKTRIYNTTQKLGGGGVIIKIFKKNYEESKNINDVRFKENLKK